MEMTTWLPVAWFAVIGFGVLMYVVLDGFVLGIGILAPMAEDEEQLDIMMNTAAPIWDGNETWLVLGGAGLMAAFPKAYAALLSALYLPILLLVVALVFRGVAFEFRFKAHRSRRLWSVAFGLGSLLAAFAQGVILGALVQGLQVVDGRYVGGAFSWFSPFSMLTGAAVVFGYALLGSTWLSPVPLLTLGVAVALWRSAMHPRRDLPPFLLTLALFILGFIGLVLGMWPYLLPPSMTLWQAAAPASSLGFSLVGLVVLLPVILGYTAWSYRVFRGKVRADAGYH
jgi:cytochrome d ubiquinol oxidase subunit II